MLKGSCSFGNRSMKAHRTSYLFFVGDLVPGQHVHHVCENRRCVNPAHLEQVSPRDHALEKTPNTVSYINFHKTTCPRGHEYNRTSKIGRRYCTQCKAEWARMKRAEVGPKPLPKTHCRREHEYTPENTRIYQGRRYCKACHAENTLRYYHDRKEVACQQNADSKEITASSPPN